MTNNSLFNFNRQQYLKTWQPIPNLYSEPELIQYYNHKMETDGVDIKNPEKVLDEVYGKPNIDAKYLKHLALMHMSHLIYYIESQGVVLGDVKWNIKQILNEIINNQVDEDYYLNTIDIYESIGGFNDGEADIYYLIDQAIRLDNKRILYYLIFKRDEEMVDKLFDVINE